MTSPEGATGGTGGTRPGDGGEAQVADRSTGRDVPVTADPDPDHSADLEDLDADAEEQAAPLEDAAGVADAASVIRDVVEHPDQSSEEAVAEAVDLAQRLERERDEYLDHLRRLKADFENYKRRVASQQSEQRSMGALELVKELLVVLDAFDAAVEHGGEEIEPLRSQFRQTLEKQGLTVLSEAGVPFDPNMHEAVMHEEGDGEPVVAEVLRTGYLWNGRVARAAMVRVRG